MADSDTQRRPPAPRRAPNGKYWAWNNRGSGNWYLRDDLKNRAKYEEPEQEERKPSGRKERQLEDSNLEVEGERKKEDSTRPSPVSRRRRQYSPRPGDMLTEREVEPHEKDGLEDGDGPRPRTRRGLSPTSRREPRPSREIDPGIEDDVDTFRELRSLDGSDRLRGEVDSYRRQSLERRRERVQGRLSEHEDTLREAAQESDSSDLDDDEREQERVLAEARARQAAIARARQREQKRLANERRGIDLERVRERRDDFGDDSERTPEGSEGIDPFVPEGELDIDRQVVDYEGPPAQTDREELIRKAALLEAEIRLGRRGRLPKQKLSSRLRTLASHAEMAREHSSEFDEEVGSVRDDLVDDSESSEEDDSEVPGILGEIVSEAERPERDEPATEKRSQAAQFRPADQLRSSAEFDGEDIPDMLREVLSEVERPGLDKPAAGETAEADPITGESEGDPQTGDPLDSDSPAPDDSPTPSAEGAVSAEPTDSRPEHISTEFWSALTTDQQQRLSDGFEQYQTALGQYQSGESSREDAQTQADTYNSLIESVNSEVQTTYNRARADYSHAVAQGSIERYMGQLQHGWHVGNEVDVSGSELLEALRAHREAVSAVPEADRTPDIFERFTGRQEGLPTAGEEGADAFYATRDIKQHLAWGKDHVQFEQSLEGGQLGRPPKGSVVRSEAEQDKFLSEWEERLSNVDPTALSEEEQQGLVELVNKVATERKNLRIHNRDLERRAAKREAWQEQMRQSDRQADAVMLSRLANWKTDPNKKDVYQSQVQQYIAQGKGNTAQRQKRMQELVDTGIVEQPSAADPVDSQAVDPDTQPVEALGETVGHGPPRSIYDASIAGGSNRPTGAPPGRGGPPSTATEARKPESETPTKFLPAEPPKLSSDSDVAAFQMRDYERQQLLAATAVNQGEEAAERLSEMFGQTKYRLPGRTNEAYGVWLKNEVASQLPEGSDIDAFMREVDSAAYSAMKEVGGTATREERQAAHLTALHGALEGAADNAIKSWQVAQTEKATTDFLGQIADDDERAKAQSLVDQHGLQAGAQLFIDELNQQREDSVKINSADEAVVSQWVANLPAAYREQAQSLIAQHGTGEGLLKTIEHMKTDEYRGFDPSDPHAGLGPDDSESVWLTPASRVQSLYDKLDAPIQSVLNKQFIEQARGDVTRGGQHLTDWFAGLGEQNTQLVDDFNRDLVVQYTKKLPDEIAAQAAEAAGAAPHAAAANEAVQSIYREWLDKQPQFAQGDAASPTPIGDTVEMDELGMGLSDSYTKTPEFSPAQLRDYLVTHGQERRELTSNIEVLKEEAASAHLKDYLVTQGQESRELTSNIEALKHEAAPAQLRDYLVTHGQERRELTSNIEVLKEEAASAQIKDYLITQGQEQKELESNIEGLRDEASRDPVVFQQHLETKGQEDREIASNIEAQQRGVDDPDAKLYAEAVRHFRNPEDWKHDPRGRQHFEAVKNDLENKYINVSPEFIQAKAEEMTTRDWKDIWERIADSPELANARIASQDAYVKQQLRRSESGLWVLEDIPQGSTAPLTQAEIAALLQIQAAAREGGPPTSFEDLDLSGISAENAKSLVDSAAFGEAGRLAVSSFPLFRAGELASGVVLGAGSGLVMLPEYQRDRNMARLEASLSGDAEVHQPLSRAQHFWSYFNPTQYTYGDVVQEAAPGPSFIDAIADFRQTRSPITKTVMLADAVDSVIPGVDLIPLSVKTPSMSGVVSNLKGNITSIDPKLGLSFPNYGSPSVPQSGLTDAEIVQLNQMRSASAPQWMQDLAQNPYVASGLISLAALPSLMSTMPNNPSLYVPPQQPRIEATVAGMPSFNPPIQTLNSPTIQQPAQLWTPQQIQSPSTPSPAQLTQPTQITAPQLRVNQLVGTPIRDPAPVTLTQPSELVSPQEAVQTAPQQVNLSVPQLVGIPSSQTPAAQPTEAAAPVEAQVQVQQPVQQPVQVGVPQPVNVGVPQPVSIGVPLPVNVPVPQPINVGIPQPVQVPAPQPIAVPVPEPVEAPVPEPVETPAPVEAEVPAPVKAEVPGVPNQVPVQIPETIKVQVHTRPKLNLRRTQLAQHLKEKPKRRARMKLIQPGKKVKDEVAAARRRGQYPERLRYQRGEELVEHDLHTNNVSVVQTGLPEADPVDTVHVSRFSRARPPRRLIDLPGAIDLVVGTDIDFVQRSNTQHRRRARPVVT